MEENGIIHESDIISLDGTTDKLIGKLVELSTQIESTTSVVKESAASLLSTVKQMNAMTGVGKQQLDAAAASAARYESAQRALDTAMSETGRSLVELRLETAKVNKENAENYKFLQMAEGSYNQLAAELKVAKERFKAMSEEERNNSDEGREVLGTILELAARVKELDSAMKPHIAQINRLAKAEQELAYWQSEEGKREMELKKQIRDLKNERTKEANVTERSARANQGEATAVEIQDKTLRNMNLTLREANRIRKYEAIMMNASKESYEQMSAEYEILKIKVGKMSAAQRENSKEYVVATERMKYLMKEMIKIQEATGRHTLRVGDYRSAWDGLGISVNQIVRELPSAAMSLNTFFVAISNNIPILIDEINKAIAKNKILQEQGQKTVAIGKSIVKALLSWNTIIVLIVTALSMFGEEIFKAIGGMLNFKRATMDLESAMKSLQKEISSTNDSYGEHVLLYKRLQDAFRELETEAERAEFVKKYSKQFEDLDLNIKEAKDAEFEFIDNESEVIKSFQERARAAALYKLAAEKYNESLEQLMKAEKLKVKQQERGFLGQFVDYIATTFSYMFTGESGEILDKRIAKAYERFEELMEEGDYFKDMAKELGIDLEEDSTGSGRGLGHLRDLTEQIRKMVLDSEKKYQDSFLKIQEDSYEKQRMALVTANEQKNDELRTTYEKNLAWLADNGTKYEKLTAEQRQAIELANQEIQATIENNDKKLADDLVKLAVQTQVRRLKAEEEGMKLRLDAMKKGSKEEFELRKELLDNAMEQEIAENSLKIKEEQQSEIAIRAKYAKELAELEADWNQDRIDALKEHVNDILAVVRKGSKEELRAKLYMIELERQEALLADSLLAPEAQRGAESINATYDTKKRHTMGTESLASFQGMQAAEKAKFELVKRGTLQRKRFEIKQEMDLITTKLNLVKQGMLNLTEEEVAILEARYQELIGSIKEVTNDFTPEGLLSKIGLDDKSIDALGTAVNYVVDKLRDIFQAEEELRQQQVDAAKERVDAAKSAYDAEIEARNNGYANNVDTAKKELLLARKQQKDKEQLLKEAQARTQKLESVTQATSLVTASAELWKSFAGIPIVGPVLAIAAIGSMWASFAAAKVKAKQVSSQEYGEGGFEMLEGGSHASGHDINLGVKNRKGRRMRVEGGEALAVFNKKQTRRYGKLLPELVKSINKGLFEEQFLQSLPDMQPQVVVNNSGVDLTKIEKDLSSIKEQNRLRVIGMPDGTVIKVNKNVTTVISN